MRTGEDPLESVLAQLDRWRHLPKYRLEQHVDVLFGMTLPTVIRSVFKTEGEMHVIPEFPIHHRTVERSDSNQSFNIDFAVFTKGGEKVFLVELKTDANSIDGDQLSSMRDIAGKFKKVVKAIRSIAETSDQKPKYVHLVSELYQAGVMRVGHNFKRLDPSQASCPVKPALNDICVEETVACTPVLVLVHPGCRKPDVDVSGFCCIDFTQYAAEMRPEQPIEHALAQHLKEWQIPAGRIKPRWQSNDFPNQDS